MSDTIQNLHPDAPLPKGSRTGFIVGSGKIFPALQMPPDGNFRKRATSYMMPDGTWSEWCKDDHDIFFEDGVGESEQMKIIRAIAAYSGVSQAEAAGFVTAIASHVVAGHAPDAAADIARVSLQRVTRAIAAMRLRPEWWKGVMSAVQKLPS